MGDSDGSSGAAQRAPAPLEEEPEEQPEEKAGFFGRILEALSPSEEDPDGVPRGKNGVEPLKGMANLRRMRVEDVAIPTAEIVAVPNSISLADLVQVFRESGMTRIPVYEGTLDTPLGFIHLKDLALGHGFSCDERGSFDAACAQQARERTIAFFREHIG